MVERSHARVVVGDLGISSIQAAGSVSAETTQGSLPFRHQNQSCAWLRWMGLIPVNVDNYAEAEWKNRQRSKQQRLKVFAKGKKKKKQWNHLISHPYLSGRYCNLWSLLQSLWAELGYVPHVIMSYYLLPGRCTCVYKSICASIYVRVI